MTECLTLPLSHQIPREDNKRGRGRGEDILKQTQNNLRNGGMNVHTDDYLK